MSKSILIILAFTLVTYANSLSNGFVRDDEIIIVDNSFYRSWKNLPQLFQKDYLTDTHKGYFHPKDYHSGAVAYRPVSSLTYFWDYGIWKLNSFGYHLQNLIWHTLNSILVFFLVNRMGIKNQTALLSAILFSTHPVQSEAVCNSGFRADLLSFFFLASAFLGYLRYSDAHGSRKSFFIVISLVLFFLALFSKESAVVFPQSDFPVLWFFVSLIPVSNIIPLANPMAYRFLYLPSVGFAAMIGLGMERISFRWNFLKNYPNLKSNVRRLLIGAYILMTVSLNGLWKSNYAVASELIRYYPHLPQGYVILEKEYLTAGLEEKAKRPLERAAALGSNDPRAYYMLGICYLGSPEVSEKYLKEALALEPEYFPPYDLLGQIYLSRKDYDKALLYLKRSLELEPRWPGHYSSLIRLYFELNRFQEARSVLEKAQEDLKDQEEIKSLQELMMRLRGKDGVEEGEK